MVVPGILRTPPTTWLACTEKLGVNWAQGNLGNRERWLVVDHLLDSPRSHWSPLGKVDFAHFACTATCRQQTGFIAKQDLTPFMRFPRVGLGFLGTQYW